MIKLCYSNSHPAILNITLEVRENLLGLQSISTHIYRLTSHTANTLMKKQLILTHEICNYMKYPFVSKNHF